MKTMKLTFRVVILALGLFASSAMFAQDEAKPIEERMDKKGKMVDKERPSSVEMAAKLTEKIKQEPTLSEEQTAKVMEINKIFMATRKTPKGDKDAMKEATTSRLEASKSVLTKEQITKFKKKTAAAVDKRRNEKVKAKNQMGEVIEAITKILWYKKQRR